MLLNIYQIGINRHSARYRGHRNKQYRQKPSPHGTCIPELNKGSKCIVHRIVKNANSGGKKIMQNKDLTDQEIFEQEVGVLALGMDMWEEHFRQVQFLEPET